VQENKQQNCIRLTLSFQCAPSILQKSVIPRNFNTSDIASSQTANLTTVCRGQKTLVLSLNSVQCRDFMQCATRKDLKHTAVIEERQRHQTAHMCVSGKSPARYDRRQLID